MQLRALRQQGWKELVNGGGTGGETYLPGDTLLDVVSILNQLVQALEEFQSMLNERLPDICWLQSSGMTMKHGSANRLLQIVDATTCSW